MKNKVGRNVRIWNCYQGPYFRFPVERLGRTRQHNLLVALAAKGEDVFYCAPIFIGNSRLQEYFVRDQVMANSRFFYPGDMGPIADFDQHHVSCDPSGAYGFFHSDPRRIEYTLSWEALLKASRQRAVDIDYSEALLSKLNASVKEVFGALPSVPVATKEKGLIQNVAYVLRRYFGVGWLIL
ncbi:MAG: hypothetical protein QY317_02965 [Candidatus Jettenia caeni]|nr:MAG: hypothetical protein QY317_02965 [Candidatus Jettenia caeni]